MKRSITLALILILSGAAIKVYAQDPEFSQFYANPLYLNPAMAGRFTEIFKTLGYRYVTLDLEGYRTGSLNEVL